MTGMTVTWDLAGARWADVVVADDEAYAHVTASYVTSAPEDLLTTVARLVLGERETRAQFDAEPVAFRWIFARDGTEVRIRLLEVPDGRRHDHVGTEVWSSQQTVDTVARAVIRCFDQVAHRYGEHDYHDKWRGRFPRSELETLRTAWHQAQR